MRRIIIITAILVQSACATFEAPEQEFAKWQTRSILINEKLNIEYAIPPNAKIEKGCKESIAISGALKATLFCAPLLGSMPRAYGHIIFLEYWYSQGVVNEYDVKLMVNDREWFLKKGLSNSNTPFAWAYTKINGNDQIVVKAFSTREIGLEIIEKLVNNGFKSIKINAL